VRAACPTESEERHALRRTDAPVAHESFAFDLAIARTIGRPIDARDACRRSLRDSEASGDESSLASIRARNCGARRRIAGMLARMQVDWNTMARTLSVIVWGAQQDAERTLRDIALAFDRPRAQSDSRSIAAIEISVGDHDGFRTIVRISDRAVEVASRRRVLDTCDGLLFVVASADYLALHAELAAGLQSSGRDLDTLPRAVVMRSEVSTDEVAASLAVDWRDVFYDDRTRGAGLSDAITRVVELVLADARTRSRRATLPSFPTVVLVATGDHLGAVVDLVEQVTGRPRKEVLALVATMPSVITTSCAPRDAFVLKRRFEAIGASVELRSEA
jgi:hypothetical protein